MSDPREDIKQELKELIKLGNEMLSPHFGNSLGGEVKSVEEEKKKALGLLKVRAHYQSWYSKSLRLLDQVLPDRVEEFRQLYSIDKRKEIDALTYTISDYLLGVSVTRFGEGELFDHKGTFTSKFLRQVQILASAQDRIESVLSDIQGVLQAELFDSELSAATELWSKGHLRASGALAGVTLEAHLSNIASNHKVLMRKKAPHISDWNDALKKASVYDVPSWRLIQRLGDIRNLCVHFKDREPTKDEVDDLIQGVSKVIKTIF